MLARNLKEVIFKLKVWYSTVLRFVSGLCRDMTSAVVLLSSPQFPAKYSELTQLLTRQVHRQIFWLVVVDDVPLHVQQGTMFCNEI